MAVAARVARVTRSLPGHRSPAPVLPVGTDAAGSDAELHVGDDLAFDPLQVREHMHEDAHDNRGFDEG